ncbi:MAG: type II secretion system F family protein [Candidatus Woesearchaeota archaeon]
MINIVHFIFHKISDFYPGLKLKLVQAEILDSPEEFVRKTLIISLMLSFGVVVLFLGGILKGFGVPIEITLVLFPIAVAIMFFYMMRVPDIKIKRREKAINKEIVFATRFIIIEIESGVPIYNAFVNVAKAYPAVGRYYGAIVEKVNLGTSMDDAITEATEIVPSNNLRKIFWQILNSIKTGADVTTALSSVLEQIVREQKIEVEEYGRKLNPLAMFYMLIAVILPSLGTTMLIIFSSFIGFKLSLVFLLMVAGMLGFIQFMFYAIIKSSRPSVEL